MPPKPTAAQRAQAADIAFRMVVLGHTRARTIWNDAKRDASKHIDVRVFDKNLAKSLDALNETCQSALEILKIHGTVDARTTTPVLKRAQKVYDVLRDYHQKYKAGRASTTGLENKAWGKIYAGINLTATEIRQWLKPLEDAGMSTSSLRRPALEH